MSPLAAGAVLVYCAVVAAFMLYGLLVEKMNLAMTYHLAENDYRNAWCRLNCFRINENP